MIFLLFPGGTLKESILNTIPDNLFRQLVDNSPNRVFLVYSDLSFCYCNELCCRTINMSREAIAEITDPLRQIMRLSEKQIAQIESSLSRGYGWTGETKTLSPEGEDEWWQLTASVLYKTGNGKEVWGLFRIDITEQKLNEQILHYRANHDPNTSLPNLHALEETLAVINYTHRVNPHKRYAMLLVSLDNISYVNTVLGDSIREEVMNEVVRRLRGITPHGNTLFSVGAGEFVSLLEIEGKPQAENFADRILASIRHPYKTSDMNTFINSTIAITFYPDDTDDTKLMLGRARVALNTIKGKHPGSRITFRPGMMENVARRSEINNLLYSAIINNELSLRFQPKVDSISREITGAEVLLRWHSAKLGQISPDEFISVAEENGQISEISRWLVRETCKQAKKWREEGVFDKPLAVNMCARDLYEPEFISYVLNTAAEAGMPPHTLDFEITESALIENRLSAAGMLDELHKNSMGIAIDDFGTGYSSLSYLPTLPIDLLKIDKSFIRDIPGNPKNVSVVNAIIAMGKSLGVKIVAEGVENIDQYHFLCDLGCDYIQGYFFYQPLTADEFAQIISKNRKQTSAHLA